MKTFRLHKLVRDDLVAMMQQAGQTVDSRVLQDKEYVDALHAKLAEELAEFNPASDSALSELADLKEVIEQLAYALGSDTAELVRIQQAKAQKSGGFAKKLFVETVSMSDDDPWVQYYSADPERFPEVSSS